MVTIRDFPVSCGTMRTAIGRVALTILGFFMSLVLLLGLFVVWFMSVAGLRMLSDGYRRNINRDLVPLHGIYDADDRRVYENFFLDYPTLAVPDILISLSATLAVLAVSWCCFTWPFMEERRRQFGVLVLLWSSCVIAMGFYYSALLMTISIAHGRWDTNLTRVRDGVIESFWDQARALDFVFYPLTFEAIHMGTHSLARLAAAAVGWGLAGCVLFWWSRRRQVTGSKTPGQTAH